MLSVHINIHLRICSTTAFLVSPSIRNHMHSKTGPTIRATVMAPLSVCVFHCPVHSIENFVLEAKIRKVGNIEYIYSVGSGAIVYRILESSFAVMAK